MLFRPPGSARVRGCGLAGQPGPPPLPAGLSSPRGRAVTPAGAPAEGPGGVAVLTAVERRAASAPRCRRGTGPSFPEVRQQLVAGGFLGAGYGPGFGLVSRDGRARAGAERRSWCLLDHPESPGWRLGQAFQRESAVTEGPAAQDALPCPAPRTQKPPSPWDGRTASRARLWLQPGTASCSAGCGAVGRTGSCEPHTTLVRCLQ